MRTFSASTIPEEYLPRASLHHLSNALAGREWVLVGATARDIALFGGGVWSQVRRTLDVDVAVALDHRHQHEVLLQELGTPRAAWQRVDLDGRHPVDVVPFGALAPDGVVEIAGTRLNVLAFAEAAATADRLEFDDGRLLPFASLEMLAVLKLLAFHDRQPGTTKDADDLLLILEGSSRGTYLDEVYTDDEALTANDFDPVRAGPWRIGRTASQLLVPQTMALVHTIAEQLPDQVSRRWPSDRHPLLTAWLEGLTG